MSKYEVTRYYSSTVTVEANSMSEASDKAGDETGSLQLIDTFEDVKLIDDKLINNNKQSKYPILNFKLQKLYELLNEVEKLVPEKHLTYELDELFSSIDDLVFSFEDSGTEDSCVPELHEVEILFKAFRKTNSNKDDLEIMFENVRTQYKEFIMESTDVKEEEQEDGTEYTVTFKGVWFGDIDEAKRLTHHAEGFYDDTSFEYVHVEVNVDGEWFGR